MTGWRMISLSVFLALLSFFIVLTADREFEDPDQSTIVSSIQNTFLPKGGRFILPLFDFDQTTHDQPPTFDNLSDFNDLILQQPDGQAGQDLKIRLPAARLADNTATIARALARRASGNDIRIAVMGHSSSWMDDMGRLADSMTGAGMNNRDLSIGLSDGPADYIDIIIARPVNNGDRRSP